VSVTIASTIQNEIDTPQPDQPVVSGVPVEGPISFGDFGSNIGTPAVVAPPAPPPVVAAVPPAVVRRVGQGVREPKKIVDVAPVYPDIARRARIQGMVILEAVINEHGGVERLKVLRSVPLLDSAAIDAVSAWRYTPTLLNGLPVSVLMTITINFTLQN
jgi:protein TonB